MFNMSEALKERSKTEVFKEHLQTIIYQQTGKKVSKSKAWEIFKAITHGTVEFVLNIPQENEGDEKKLPLAGVGTFQILETSPRGSKAGLDKEGNPIEGAVPWPCVPRFRFYPSSTIDTLCEYKYGLGGHEVNEKHYGLFVEDVATDEDTTLSVLEVNEAPVEVNEAPVEVNEESNGAVSDDLFEM